MIDNESKMFENALIIEENINWLCKAYDLELIDDRVTDYQFVFMDGQKISFDPWFVDWKSLEDRVAYWHRKCLMRDFAYYNPRNNAETLMRKIRLNEQYGKVGSN